MFWVINLVIIGWISGISVGLGVDFRENPVSDLGLGAAMLLEAPRGVAPGAAGPLSQRAFCDAFDSVSLALFRGLIGLFLGLILGVVMIYLPLSR